MWVSKYGQTQIQEVNYNKQLQLPKFAKNWSQILLWKCSIDEVPKTMNSQFTVKFKAATRAKTRKWFPSRSSQRNGNSQLGHSRKFKIGNGCHEVLKQKMNSEFFTVTNTWWTFLTMWEPLHYVMSCLF
jgi:hypothetical protein